MLVDERFRESVAAAREAREVSCAGITRKVFDVSGIPGADRLPRALVVLLENVVRRAATLDAAIDAAARVVEAGLAGKQGDEIEFMPARVLFQDFTGVPVFVDFAAMRDAMVERGGDPKKVNPQIPCTLIIDHSVIADEAGTETSCAANQLAEVKRNRERFAFLKWAQSSFDNVEIVPPGGGICHQLNIERFSSVVCRDALAKDDVACFDTLVGTDSHTTTANGLGVLGWGVGGIEAEACALGQPISMLVPPVVELRLEGELKDGVSGMDLALTVCRLLRKEGVVGTLVEVTGPGVATLSATQRSCVANMTPEYGCTTTLFPTDAVVLDYLRLTGRDEDEVAFAETFLEAQGVFGETSGRTYSRTITFDLAEVRPCLAGPSRPHNYVEAAGLPARFWEVARTHGHGDTKASFTVEVQGSEFELSHGVIALAAITSCTTETDPKMMVAAGLAAKRARKRGLAAKPWVKRVFAPGSRATELLLRRAGLLGPLFELGFATCGFGCMSCIGNSGEIASALHEQAQEMELTSVLSGNRNFDGRISPDVAQNFLMSPAAVVCYALAGTVDIDLSTEPVGYDSEGEPVMMSELMPTDAEVEEVLAAYLDKSLFAEGTANLFEGSAAWQEIACEASDTFAWDEDSTYVRKPPYFDDARVSDVVEVTSARPLVFVGDFVTTDHISPAGTIAPTSPAARYLTEHGVAPQDFNTYGARRGNHEVMMRGTFANVRLENQLGQGRKGGWTTDFLSGEVTSVYDAAMDYREANVTLIGVAGKLYGSGSSRDWAGKGPALLGIRAVIAESFERIHRSNLVQMGVVPLEFADGKNAESLGLDGTETYSVAPIDLTDEGCLRSRVKVCATRGQEQIEFDCIVRIDTPSEAEYVRAGGILPYVLETLA